MKKITLTIFFLFAFFSKATTQTITFDSTYSKFTDYYFVGAIQKKDSSYIVAFTKNSMMKLLFIDTKGRNIDSMQLTYTAVNRLRINPLCSTPDGGFIVVTSKVEEIGSNSIVNIFLIKFSSENNIEWQKSYGDSLQDEYGIQVIQSDDDGFIIAGARYNSNYFEKTIIIKIDSVGNIIWRKTINFPFTNTSGMRSIINLTDNSFLIVGGSYFFRFNQNGDSLSYKSIILNPYSITPTKDGNFLVCTKTKLYKFDYGGVILWTKEFPSRLSDAVETFDNRIALVSFESNIRYLRILDAEGNVLELINLPGNPLCIQETWDKGLLISGLSKYSTVYGPLWLMKTNSDYKVKRISIYSGGEFFVNHSSLVFWQSEAVNKIDLYFSIDGGLNWNEIVKSLPDTGSYNWIVPELPTFYGKFKIVDSECSELFDICDDYFSIRYPGTTDYISINQIFMYIGSNGMGSRNPYNGGSGLYWPGGKDATLTAVFADGLVWGGKVNGEIRVNGNTFRNGLMPGIILPDGLPDNPLKKEYRIWKIRKDWETLPSGNERDKYQYDYENWPGDLGAPYEDVNFDGQFTSGVDKPKFYGDETLWFVANDMDTAATNHTYGSKPIGLEVQVTTYGYNRTDELGDVVFKKYKLINKSNNPLTDAYFGYFSDTDLGNASDDYVGCDTLINLGYCYNGDNVDQGEYETPPPAIGYLLLQGPIVNAETSDSAFFNDRWLKEKKNLVLSSSVPNLKNGDWTHDPYQGGYAGSLQYYNFFNGLTNDGEKLVDPNTGDTTKFGLAGDPVAGIGWYEGAGWPGGPDPADRRVFVSSGPFYFAVGDTQEVVYAIIMARGSDNINSVKVLKDKAKAVTNFYYLGILSNVKDNKTVLVKFYLYQNYPNPFNPSTTIKYSIPTPPVSSPLLKGRTKEGFVTLKVYDILGREVTTLVNEEKPAGNYQVTFDGSKLSSGVYFYQLKTGTNNSTKKLLLVK